MTLTAHLNAARDAWYNDPGESERLIRLAQDQLKQEREWESERIAKLAAISARRGRRHDGR